MYYTKKVSRIIQAGGTATSNQVSTVSHLHLLAFLFVTIPSTNVKPESVYSNLSRSVNLYIEHDLRSRALLHNLCADRLLARADACVNLLSWAHLDE